ncbi:MAG TPA: hypothetical protein VF665_21715 [Longimicrobium sp.]|jgi:hypothetical protein|uniref:hypothetical protein n=1 Tax=Longimicrobium sp. TaxID=2029185 RepID=UPI002ED8471F
MEPDFVVRSPNGQILLAVEVKNRPHASPQWAAELRRNLIVNGVLPRAPYFLLALPDRFLLWKQRYGAEAVPPDYQADAEQVLRPFTDSLRRPLSSLSSDGFNMLVGLWLDDLVHKLPEHQANWLAASGLGDRLRDAVVSSPRAA